MLGAGQLSSVVSGSGHFRPEVPGSTPPTVQPKRTDVDHMGAPPRREKCAEKCKPHGQRARHGTDVLMATPEQQDT